MHAEGLQSDEGCQKAAGLSAPFHNLPFLVDKELGEVPLEVASQDATLLGLQKAKHRIRCTEQYMP